MVREEKRLPHCEGGRCSPWLRRVPAPAPGRAGTPLREPFQDRGAPAALPSPAAPGPPWKGLNFGPRSADTRGSVNAMTSPLGSAAQQETLSASPLPARRKWGSFFPAAAAAPAETYFRGRLLPVGEEGAGRSAGDKGPRGGGCTCFAMAHFTDFARGLRGAEKTGMWADHWPWGVHITCIIEGTPCQVGQKHWRAPEIGPNSAE